MYWRTTTTQGGSTWTAWRGGSVGYGELEYQESTTDETVSGGGTALRDLPITHATFSLNETRIVMVTIVIPVAGAVNDSCRIRLTNSSNTDLAVSGRLNFIAGTVLYELALQRRMSLASGSYDWRLRIERTAGTGGNVWMPANSTNPGFILVRDIGFAG
jgi:hypothetical protein